MSCAAETGGKETQDAGQQIVLGGVINFMGIAGLVFGVISITGSFIPFVNILTLVLGLIGIFCSVAGRKKAFAANQSTAAATVGLLLNITGMVFSAAGVICLGCVIDICSSIIDYVRTNY